MNTDCERMPLIYYHCRLSVDQMQAELRMEVATWQLFHVLGRDRMEETTDDMMLDVLGENGLSDKEIADQLFARSSFIRQTQASHLTGSVQLKTVCVCVRAASGGLARGTG